MTIDMEEPFIWPDVPQDVLASTEATRRETIKVVNITMRGSDLTRKPLDAFDGIGTEARNLPSNFIPIN